ncbi:MAG TPA: glycosyltransferase N-terminal domain-containing protein [Gemmatimonadales bacterium]|nr:glycosyltransferase N-terminal domain-containing protein [Gemmatimonadales bacterium]
MLVRLGISLAPLAARSRPKLRDALAARAGVLERLGAWARVHRQPGRPLLWMHASSVGEGLQAEVVLEMLRPAHPDWQIVYTHFSPSAEALARRMPADLADYLPWDRPRDVDAALDALRPTALIFCKLDLWPELATRAAARGVAVGMIAATVSPVSRRSRWPGRALIRAGYRAVWRAGAVSEPDAARLANLGVPASVIEVTGDPRFDSALARARTIRPDDPLVALGRGAQTLVAGSTWEEDEQVLLPAFGAVRAARPDVRLIIVPHEPTPEHLARLDGAAAELGLPAPRRLGDFTEPAPLMVSDRVGGLATLYSAGQIAYVGGGFGTSGLHSVLEPAACGKPVLFGPRWQSSREAGLLLARRAAVVVSPKFCDWLDLDASSTQGGANPLAAIWLALLRNPDHARAAGRRALECVEAGLGAAVRSTHLVEALMSRSAQGTETALDAAASGEIPPTG